MKYFWLVLLSPSILFAAPVISPPATFGLGLNQKGDASSINEQETPDSNNTINTTAGTMEKRQGSRLFIGQAFSTEPFNSLYRAYGSTQSVDVKRVLLAATGTKMLYSTGGVNPFWTTLSSGHPKNSHWEFQTMQNRVIMAEETLQTPLKSYNIVTASMTNLVERFLSTEAVSIRAKHILVASDQLLAANVAINISPAGLFNPTTDYFNSRLYYSRLFQPSSFTYNRYLSLGEDDGEEITGISVKDATHVWKPSKVFEVAYGDYGALETLPLGGTYVVSTIVKGFGLFAPRSLASNGDVYIFADRGGVRFWDGGKKTRLQAEQESRVVSDPIQPIVDRCIEAGTWKDVVGFYYPQMRWYMLSIEDPNLNPHGKKNRILVLDMDTLSWFSFTNWDAEAFASWDGAGDLGELTYGSASDGYVYFANDPVAANDARRELPVQDMDNQALWRGPTVTQELTSVKEGTAAVKLVANTQVRFASATWMNVIRMGEWQDKKQVKKSDLLSFWVYAASVTNLRALRIDLDVDGSGLTDFTQNFTSVTFTSAALTNNGWTKINVALSSFPILPAWTDLATEDLQFSDTLTFFGLRIFSTGTAGYTIIIDDMRVVGATERPLSAYRWNKMTNFGVASGKDFKSIILNGDFDQDSEFFVDIYKDFGSFVDRQSFPRKFSKEIFVGTYGGQPKIIKLDSVNFSQLISTEAGGVSAFSVESIASDENFIFAGDQYNNRIFKISKSSFTTFVSSYGSLGSGATNFNAIGQMGVDETYLYVCDTRNHRVKVHRKDNLAFVRAFGQLGLNTTSFHLPMGVAVDGGSGVLYVVNDGNYRILKLKKDDGSFLDSVSLAYDTFGEASLAVDEKNLYVAYRAVDPASLEHTKLVLERRDKVGMNLLDKVFVEPDAGAVVLSTMVFEGDISLSGQYIYMVFTPDVNGNGSWYLQKRLKSDFSIVKELVSSQRIGTVSANERSYRPSRQTLEFPLSTAGIFLQVKFYEDEDSLDNHLKLFNQAYKLIPQEIR